MLVQMLAWLLAHPEAHAACANSPSKAWLTNGGNPSRHRRTLYTLSPVRPPSISKGPPLVRLRFWIFNRSCRIEELSCPLRSEPLGGSRKSVIVCETIVWRLHCPACRDSSIHGCGYAATPRQIEWERVPILYGRSLIQRFRDPLPVLIVIPRCVRFSWMRKRSLRIGTLRYRPTPNRSALTFLPPTEGDPRAHARAHDALRWSRAHRVVLRLTNRERPARLG